VNTREPLPLKCILLGGCGRTPVPVDYVRHKLIDGLVGFLLGVAFMLAMIQIWGLTWVRFLAPSWKPGL